MPASVDLSKVSPSKIGEYAACRQRLVYDTDCPPGYSENKWAAFGTVCHYVTMYKLGCAPPKPPDTGTLTLAKELVPGGDGAFNERLEACSDLAVRALNMIEPLKEPAQWLCEVEKYDHRILPERVSRSGKKGFGGSIDLLGSDLSRLVDLKFVTKPPYKIKIVYVWQLGCYHIVAEVPRTTILYIGTDAKEFWYGSIDWSSPTFAPMAQHIRGFIDSTGHADFRRTAYPMPGEHCEYCEHGPPTNFKPGNGNRCPMQKIPQLITSSPSAAPAAAHDPMKMLLGDAVGRTLF